MSTEGRTNPLTADNLSVESSFGLVYQDGIPALDSLFMGSSEHTQVQFEDADMEESGLPVEQSDVESLFPGITSGDFTEVEKVLTSASSQEDLVAYLQKPDDGARGTGELDVCLAKVSSQADLFVFGERAESENFNLSKVKMEIDVVPIDIEEVLQLVKQDEEQLKKEFLPVFGLPASFEGMALSPGVPAEASDHSVAPSQLPSLPMLAVHQQPVRFAACQPLLNGFETASTPEDEAPASAAVTSATVAAAVARSKSKPSTSRRRVSAAVEHVDKTYLAMCQKNRIFDSGAKLRYGIDQKLQRDAIVEEITGYVKQCLDPERDRVHRFLMVMLVDGQLERGPFWRFFQDAVYFCDGRKERLVKDPGPMFHIKQSAYVGLLWGRYKGNECFDYATLGDAIKSVKSKPNGEQYFVDPDFGHLHGKPKRLFQFGPTAIEEICRYKAMCASFTEAN